MRKISEMQYSLTEEQLQRIFDQQWISWMIFVMIGVCFINILYSFLDGERS